MIDQSSLVQLRCPTCNRLLMRLCPGSIVEVKCNKCKTLTSYDCGKIEAIEDEKFLTELRLRMAGRARIINKC